WRGPQRRRLLTGRHRRGPRPWPPIPVVGGPPAAALARTCSGSGQGSLASAGGRGSTPPSPASSSTAPTRTGRGRPGGSQAPAGVGRGGHGGGGDVLKEYFRDHDSRFQDHLESGMSALASVVLEVGLAPFAPSHGGAS